MCFEYVVFARGGKVSDCWYCLLYAFGFRILGSCFNVGDIKRYTLQGPSANYAGTYRKDRSCCDAAVRHMKTS